MVSFQIGTKGDNGRYRVDWETFLADENVSLCAKEHIKSIRYKEEYKDFAFPLILIARQKCGHYEVLEAPYERKSKKWISELLKQTAKYSKTHLCAHCSCLPKKKRKR